MINISSSELIPKRLRAHELVSIPIFPLVPPFVAGTLNYLSTGEGSQSIDTALVIFCGEILLVTLGAGIISLRNRIKTHN